MSIKDQLDLYTSYVGQAETDLTNIKTALTAKEVEVPETTKLSNVPALIGSIKNDGGVELVISAADYEGQTLTATKGEKSVKAQVESGIARIPVDEEGEWTVSADDGNSTKVMTDMTFEGELSKSKTYGVKKTEAEADTAKRLVYIGDAVGMQPVKVDQSSGTANYNGWDEKWIFDKIYPVMLSRTGEEVYRLNKDDQTKREDGGASDIASMSFDGNAMVCIEKFYTKYSMDGNDEVLEICNQKKEGFEAIGFIREDGTEADKIYLSMFGGCKDSSGRLRSISGQSWLFNTSFTDFRTAAQKNGSGYDIDVYSMVELVRNLYYILMKDCNLSKAIGTGKNYNGAKTGTLANKGAIAYDPSSKAVKFLWLEDFFSTNSNGIWRWEAGILSQSSKIYVKMKPPYSGTSTSGYTQISDYAHGSGYISRMKCSNQYGSYPIAYEGSNSTYEASQWYDNTGSGVCVSQRGNHYGVAGRAFDSVASNTYTNIGAALSFLPPA